MTPTISSLTDAELRRSFDSGSFSRGKAYAHAGRVTLIDLEPDGDAASAQVRGSGTQSYSATVQLRETRAGGTHIWGTCSCFVGHNCKHVVALIIAVRGSIESVEAESDPEPAAPATLPQDSW
ncbi:MAG: SWIM zinc finger family protein, partial [Aeromicrobium sp.]